MEKFINKIKEVLIKAKEEYSVEIDVMGYVETLRQNKEDIQKAMKVVLDGDELKENVNIKYLPDVTLGYTNGSLELTEEYNGKTIGYEMLLRETTSTLKDCDCNPNDPLYNKKHHCCGIDCGCHDMPLLEISDINNKDKFEKFEFNGLERDLWNIRDGIVEDTKELLINRITEQINNKKQYIEKLENNIYDLQEQLNKLQGIA